MSKLLNKWIKALVAVDLSVPLPQQRVRDTDDTSLGTLDEALQKYWSYLESLRLTLEGINGRLADLNATHDADKERLGESMPTETLRAYTEARHALEEEFHGPAFDYTVLRPVFWTEVAELFKAKDGKPVYGIRENNEVVCRTQDDRGDGRNPIDEWKKLTGCTCPICQAIQKRGLGLPLLLGALVSMRAGTDEPGATPPASAPPPARG